MPDWNPETSPHEFPWHEIQDRDLFASWRWTRRLEDGMLFGSHDPERRKSVVSLLSDHSATVIQRLKELETELNRQLVKKEEIIRMVFVSAIAYQPMLLIGPPGTAKSRIILKFCEGLGIGRMGGLDNGPEAPADSQGAVFQYLLHGFTEPDEILGIVDLNALKEERVFQRLRPGSITEAEVVFLDEVFKANSAILNALLTIINERQVYEGGRLRRARARLVFGASNAVPAGRRLEELRAFYERFVVRMRSSLVASDLETGGMVSPDRQNLLRQGWAGEVRDLRVGYRPAKAAMSPIACLNDILFLNRVATELWGGDDIENEFLRRFVTGYHQLVTVLNRTDPPCCTIDDRKLIRLFLLLRAHALFEHNGPPGTADLTVLKHIWSDVESQPILADQVDRFITSQAG